jgi:predicted dithiol-disulfide oxidoreductase (DUF899 family)
MAMTAVRWDQLRLWPHEADRDYVDARAALLREELALRSRLEEAAALRRALPAGALLGDYTFQEGPPDLTRDVPVARPRLRELFGAHDSLFIYHLMFAPEADSACEMCSMWVDGLHGVSHHLARHTAFVVIAKAPLVKLRAWARRRGWDGLRVLSSHGTSFNADLDVETPDGAQRPGVSVLVREGGSVRHFYTMQASFPGGDGDRGIDLLSPVWQVLDLLPHGRGNWYPDNEYPGRKRGGR